jgi:hypothetical protein
MIDLELTVIEKISPKTPDDGSNDGLRQFYRNAPAACFNILTLNIEGCLSMTTCMGKAG